ncbi:SCO family protein [Effusibacillus consociatus]|uniref:SCO family protein n=1 Tax=Effusibacillus consociatus TaxID=1117041 RepID=A0ABV9QBL4_9BACL
MQSRTGKYAVNSFIIILIIAFIGGLSYWIWWGKTRLPVIDRAPNWTLENVNGGYESSQALGNKVKLVEFIFVNCPDVCPTTTHNMVSLQEKLKQKNLFGSDVQFVAISFDPVRDTREVLKNYGNNLKVDWNGWTMYRGTEEETQKVLKDFKIFAEKQPDGSYVHPTKALFLIDRNNNIRKIYTMGENMNNQEILKDIVQLAKE